jgi:MFS family permease
MLPGVALFGLAILGVTLVHGQLWQLYLCYVLVGLTAGVQNMVAYNKLASVWFQRHRGLVLSFLSTCYGVAAAIIPQIVRPLIDHHGWQAGYWFLGAVVLSSLLVLVPWLRLPRDRITPDTVTSGAVGERRDLQTAAGISAKEARNKFIFWLLLLVVVLAVGSLIGTVAQLFPMLTDRGVSRQNATTVLSFTAIGGILGQLSYGYLMDKFRTPKMAAPFFVCALIGATILHREAAMNALLPGAVLMGIGQGAELGLAAYLTSRYFGTRHMGEIYGLLYAGATIAAGVGPVLMARAYDYTGSYRPMLLASELALVAVVAFILMLPRYVYPITGQATGSAPATPTKS